MSFLTILGGGGPAVFNPATLSLTGWWRDFGGLPWAGTASAGGSGSVSLVTSGANPTVGSSQNTHASVSFDGSQYVHNGAPSSLFGTHGSMWCLIRATATPTASASSYKNGNLLTDSGNGDVAFGYCSDGAIAEVYDGVDNRYLKIAGDLTGAYHLLQFSFDGTHLRGRVDSGAFSQVVCANGNYIGEGSVLVGRSYAGTILFTGTLLELATSDIALSDANFDSIKSYVNARYALTL